MVSVLDTSFVLSVVVSVLDISFVLSVVVSVLDTSFVLSVVVSVLDTSFVLSVVVSVLDASFVLSVMVSVLDTSFVHSVRVLKSPCPISLASPINLTWGPLADFLITQPLASPLRIFESQSRSNRSRKRSCMLHPPYPHPPHCD